MAAFTTLTASSTSNSTSKTYAWSVVSGVGGTFGSATSATTTFTPTTLGTTVVRCQITDPVEIGSATITINSIENHYRVRVNGSWTNPPYFTHQNGAWVAGVRYGLTGTGRGGVAATANDDRAYTKTVLADNPVVYYAMQEVGGTVAIDWSGHAYHGTYQGGVTIDYAVNPYLYPPVALGRLALSNNNTSNTQYISVPGNTVDVTNGLSFEVWINSNGWNFNSALFYMSDDAGDGTDIVLYHAQNAQNLVLDVSGTLLTVPAPSPDTGGWHHIVVSIPAGGNTASIYTDGVLAGSGAIGKLVVLARQDINIGRSTPTGQSYYNGFLTQAAIYSSPLSQTQVAAHYAAGMADADPVWHGAPEWYDPSWYRGYTNATLLAQASYVPVADWMTPGGSATDIVAESPYFDIAINPAGTDFSWFRQAGISTLPASSNSQMTGTPGSETIAYFTQDETDMLGPSGLTQLQQAAATVPAGYLGYANFGTLITMGLGSASVTPQQFMNTTGINISSADLYWYATTAAGTPETQYWQLTPDQVRRACNYGAVVERERSFQTSPHPLWGFVELAHPNNTNAYGGPNPNQVEGAVWGNIIGGARGIIWFHHSFAQTDSNGNVVPPQSWNASTQYSVDDCVSYGGTYYYAALPPAIGEVPDPTSYTWVRWSSNSGAGISNVDVRHPDLQAKIVQIKADLQTMATAINSPTVPHLCHKDVYSTYRPWATDGRKYIIAMPGLAAPNGGTFSMYLPSGQNPGSIEVVGENRTITPSNGTFTDTFAAEYVHHIYRW